MQSMALCSMSHSQMHGDNLLDMFITDMTVDIVQTSVCDQVGSSDHTTALATVGGSTWREPPNRQRVWRYANYIPLETTPATLAPTGSLSSPQIPTPVWRSPIASLRAWTASYHRKRLSPDDLTPTGGPQSVGRLCLLSNGL